MKRKVKSLLHLVDPIYVGFNMILYRDFGTWAKVIAVGWITFITSVNVVLVVVIFRLQGVFVDHYWTLLSSVAVTCIITLYFNYLRDRTLTRDLMESYRHERKWEMYARFRAIVYLFSPIVLGLIHVLINGVSGE